MRRLALALVCFLPVLAACEKKADGTRPPVALPPEVSTLVLKSEPQGAIEVDALKKSVKTGDSIVVHGRFQEFNDVLASFKLVDAALPACGETEGVADGCETPWDYCCEADLPAHLVNVELRGADGAPVKAALRGASGFDHLKHAVVVGKAEVDAQGNVTIAATGVFLRS